LLLLPRLGQRRRPSGSFGEDESSRRHSAKNLIPVRSVARRPAPRAASRCAELALRHNMVLASFTRPQRPLPALSTTPTRLLKCRAEQYWDCPLLPGGFVRASKVPLIGIGRKTIRVPR